MQATGQNNSLNAIIHFNQEPVVLTVNRIDNPLMICILVLSQSFAGQIHDKCRYVLLIPARITFMVYYQNSRIMEKLS
jgi:hypothetical protein